MPLARKARPAESTRFIPTALLMAALALAPLGDLCAQDPAAEGAAAGAAEEAAEALTLTVNNGYTGKPLDTTTPAPHQGQLGDGLPDRLGYNIIITDTARSDSGEPELAADLGSLSIKVIIYDGRGVDQTPDGRNTYASEEARQRAAWPLFEEYLVYHRTNNRRTDLHGFIDLGFDLEVGAIYDFIAILERDGARQDSVPVDTFTTQFTPGMPVLSIRSTVTSGGGSGRESMRMTGKISGTSALEMSSDYLRLSGRGRIDYEDFVLIPPGGCDAGATWEGDYFWEVLEVVLADSPEEFDASLESVGGFPPPVEVVVALDPSIDEVVAIRCGPVTVPIPGFKHFFPAFYSVHGDEMSEERRGLVMTGWMPGEGDVIATRTYERAVQIENVTITESTILELRWPE